MRNKKGKKEKKLQKEEATTKSYTLVPLTS
jgi:hypothetical protein